MARITKKSELKAACEDFAAKYGGKRDNHDYGLEMLGLYLLAHDEPFHDSFFDNTDEPEVEDLKDYYAGGSFDGGIDGLIYSEDLQNVGVVQATYRSGQVGADTKDKARAFFGRLPEWLDPDKRARLNAQSRELLDACSLDPEQQEIVLSFLTSESASNDQQSEVAKLARSYQDGYRSRGWNVTCSFHTQSDIVRDFGDVKKRKLEPLVENCSFNIAEANSFEFSVDGGNRVLICAVKGNEIRDLYRRPGIGDALFNTNIRSGLKTGKVNPKIVETAQSSVESANFFYYNNGITATCTSYEKVASEVRVENLQVVNGAQTVEALA